MTTRRAVLRGGLKGAALLLIIWQMFVPVARGQGAGPWTEAIRLSQPETAVTSNPAITADMAGNVHVMWGQVTLAPPLQTGADTLFYRRWDGQQWSDPIDVLTSPDNGATEFPELATTPDGMLHAAWSTGGASGKLWYSRAPACCADRAPAWSAPEQLDGGIHGGAIAMISDAQGRLHVAFAEFDTANIVYRRSDDSGLTWSVRVTIPDGTLGDDEYATYVRLAVDGRGRVHAVWSVQPWPGRRVMYARSDDGGDTWNAPQVIDEYDPARYASAGYGPLWIDVEAHGDDEVHLIWDGAPTVERNHIRSADGGQTWSGPLIVFPELSNVGRAGWNDMAFDGGGALHAVALGQPWHAQWRDGAWSSSKPLSEAGYAENMRLTVNLGNELHVVWNRVVPDQERSVWYVRGQVSAPHALVQALPTPLPTPELSHPPSVSPAIMLSPTPTRSPVTWPADSPRGSASDATRSLIASLLPAVALVIVVVSRQLWKRRHTR